MDKIIRLIGSHQSQLTSGTCQSAVKVILAGIKLLELQEDLYQERLSELQQAAHVGWEASQRGAVMDGETAMAEIRANLRSGYSSCDES
ncbi:MAG: type II toxin-antitoxin system ParD family antitoxin [Leptolyngbyaceae bacterium]|nr:type II toxin-antitoxin system ParD family antitoxin [Leptolyngbyaceae bacterium]